ncbi:MAG: hypothetical protein GX596_13690, partial [Propionibacterium sp.]|nr:hypothetical protein [Propionibacterium sp.]
MSDAPSLASTLELLGPMPVSQPSGPASQPTPPRRVTGAMTPIDWGIVVTLRREAAQHISTASEQWLDERGAPMPDEDLRVHA